jgi:hypothetical protein
VLQTPVVVPGAGATLTGSLRLVAHRHQSYDVHLTLQAPPLLPNTPPQLVRRRGVGATMPLGFRFKLLDMTTAMGLEHNVMRSDMFSWTMLA